MNLTLFGTIPVMIINDLTNDIDLQRVFSRIDELLYDYFPLFNSSTLESVYIGNFSFLKKRQVNAMYSDGTIYISNEQDDEMDIIDDIVHEFAHLIEDLVGKDVYGDNKIKKEFYSKRSVILDNLYLKIDPTLYDRVGALFTDLEFNPVLDDLLLNTVGYDLLRSVSDEVFIEPYAITSVSEYFANGFEKYHLQDPHIVKLYYPSVYNKIREIEEAMNNAR